MAPWVMPGGRDKDGEEEAAPGPRRREAAGQGASACSINHEGLSREEEGTSRTRQGTKWHQLGFRSLIFSELERWRRWSLPTGRPHPV